jgi:putative transposase
MDDEHLRRLKELEEENRKLKSMYADLALDNKMIKDVLSRKWYCLVIEANFNSPSHRIVRIPESAIREYGIHMKIRVDNGPDSLVRSL